MAQDSDDYDVTIGAERISELQMGDAPGDVTIDRNEDGEVEVDTEWGAFTNASESQKIDIRLTDETGVVDADFDLVEDLMDEGRFTLTADAQDGPGSVTTHEPEFGEGDDVPSDSKDLVTGIERENIEGAGQLSHRVLERPGVYRQRGKC